MSRLVKALKALGKKLNTAGAEPKGKTIDEVIENIADNFNIGGATAVTVTSMSLSLNSAGKITGGVCGLSDGSSVNITIVE